MTTAAGTDDLGVVVPTAAAALQAVADLGVAAGIGPSTAARLAGLSHNTMYQLRRRGTDGVTVTTFLALAAVVRVEVSVAEAGGLDWWSPAAVHAGAGSGMDELARPLRDALTRRQTNAPRLAADSDVSYMTVVRWLRGDRLQGGARPQLAHYLALVDQLGLQMRIRPSSMTLRMQARAAGQQKPAWLTSA